MMRCADRGLFRSHASHTFCCAVVAAVGACTPAPSELQSLPPGDSTPCAPTFEQAGTHLAAGTTVAPGAEISMCLRWTTPAALDIREFVGTLGPAGHHVLLLGQTGTAQPDGLAPCSEAEIMDAQNAGAFQMLAGVSYETDGVTFSFPSSPVQVGLHVPAGTQLVFDAHFLNPGGAELDTCATLDLTHDTPVVAQLGFRTVLPYDQYSLVVPAHGAIDVRYEEPAGSRFRVAAAASHMHEGGTRFRMSVAETDRTIYETTSWSEPPPSIYDTIKLVVEPTQTLRLDCSFENATAIEQRFPNQMCVGAMYVLPCSFPGAC